MRRTAITVFLLVLAQATPALAGPRCRVALSEWQPREALQAKLLRQGWKVLSVRTDDGCYRVRGLDAAGEQRKALFDPATLEPVNRKGDDDQDD